MKIAWVRAVAAAALLACFSILSPGAAADEFRDSDRSHALTMLNGVKRAIEEGYYDPKLKGVDLDAAAEAAKARIEKATTIGAAFGAIAEFTSKLDDSHTFFLPPFQTVDVDYGWTMGMAGDACLVLSVKPGSNAEKLGVKRGDRVKAVNGLPVTRETLWRINYLFNALRPQPGLHVELAALKGETRELDIAAETKPRKKTVDLTSDFETARLIDRLTREWHKSDPSFAEPNRAVLVVRLPSFVVGEDKIREILSRATGHAALILDLRGNGGGAVSNLTALIGGLSQNDVAVGTQRERERSVPLLAKGSGQRAFTGRVFVLIDAQSASAAEIFARVMQLSERGTVIGDRSAGAVMESHIRPLVVTHGEGRIAYAVSVTTADLVMTDNGRLEKKGVAPDFTVLPSADDLAAGRDPTLAKALAFAGVELDPAAAGALLPKE